MGLVLSGCRRRLTSWRHKSISSISAVTSEAATGKWAWCCQAAAGGWLASGTNNKLFEICSYHIPFASIAGPHFPHFPIGWVFNRAQENGASVHIACVKREVWGVMHNRGIRERHIRKERGGEQKGCMLKCVLKDLNGTISLVLFIAIKSRLLFSQFL